MKESENKINDLGRLLLEGPTEPEAKREIAANLIELERCYLEIAEHKKQLAEIAGKLWDLKQHKIRHDLIILFETIAEKCERIGALKETVNR